MSLPLASAPISAALPLALGSQSPRRAEILSTLGLPFRVVRAHADERALADEPAAAYVERVGRLKLAAVAQVLEEQARRYAAILVADTAVVVDGQILGKPRDGDDALRMLRQLAGRTHEVLTHFALSWPPAGRGSSVASGAACARTVTTRVQMRAARAGELERYAASGEGLDKAGAYAVQGIGSFLVQGIEGSYTNVVGLPACELVCELQALGLLPDYPLAGAPHDSVAP